MARILVVDDSAYQRNKVRRATNTTEYELCEASNGRDGLDMVTTYAPDCILLDLIMPEMDGIEVLQILRDRGENVPVIVLTADIQESTRQQCLELGAVTFINKPLKENEILDAINQTIGNPQDTEQKDIQGT